MGFDWMDNDIYVSNIKRVCQETRKIQTSIRRSAASRNKVVINHKAKTKLNICSHNHETIRYQSMLCPLCPLCIMKARLKDGSDV